MSNPEQAIQLARSLTDEVVGLAGELLLLDADVEHVPRTSLEPCIL
jgi:hypothetical protein